MLLVDGIFNLTLRDVYACLLTTMQCFIICIDAWAGCAAKGESMNIYHSYDLTFTRLLFGFPFSIDMYYILTFPCNLFTELFYRKGKC